MARENNVSTTTTTSTATAAGATGMAGASTTAGTTATNTTMQQATTTAQPSTPQLRGRAAFDTPPPQPCTSPQQVFAVATSFAAFLACNFTQDDLQTLINIFTLLVANLAAIVTQQEICEGLIIQPPRELLS